MHVMVWDLISLTVENCRLQILSIPRQCDDNQDGIYTFNTATLQSTLLNGQTNVTVTYFDSSNNPYQVLPATFATTRKPLKRS
jgi:hypothetical protein